MHGHCRATIQLNRSRRLLRVPDIGARREIVCHAPHNARRRRRQTAAAITLRASSDRERRTTDAAGISAVGWFAVQHQQQLRFGPRSRTPPLTSSRRSSTDRNTKHVRYNNNNNNNIKYDIIIIIVWPSWTNLIAPVHRGKSFTARWFKRRSNSLHEDIIHTYNVYTYNDNNTT